MKTKSKPSEDLRWSGRVTRQSNALDLEEGVFTRDDPREIALSLARSADKSTRRKASPFRSALSMLVFYINRAGRNLDRDRLRILEQAKDELRVLYGKKRQMLEQPKKGGKAMKPIGPMMWEHRLIEKMLAAMMRHVDHMEKSQNVNPLVIDMAVDFIRTYADRTHHGKEEEIFFRDLAKKNIAPELNAIMQELLDEHAWARKKTASLVEAKEQYLAGDSSKLAEVIAVARNLGSFYPRHIEKEDKHFFYPCQDYFTKEEQEKMLAEFWEFDRKMIHEKYNRVYEEYSGIRS